MFFAIDLLCPQHGGRFSIAWICATRGVTHARRKQILECDVVKLCDEILEMMISSSNKPRLRLSLSLASRLINGMVKIHRQQVLLLQTDIIRFIQQIRKPCIISIDSAVDKDESSESMLHPKILKKRKKRIIVSQDVAGPLQHQIQEVDLQTIESELELAQTANKVNEDAITIREEIPRQSVFELDVARGFGEFGVLEDGAAPPIPDFISKRTTLPQPEQEVAQQTLPTRRTRSQLKSLTPVTKQKNAQDLDEIVVAPLPEAEVDQPRVTELIETVTEQQTEKLIEEPVAVEVPVEVRIEKPAEEQTSEQLEKLPIVFETPKRRKGIKIGPQIAKTLVKLRINRTVNINRCEVNDLEIFDLWNYINRAPIKLLRPEDDDDNLIPPALPFVTSLMKENDPFPSNIQELPGMRASLLRCYALSKMESATVISIQPTVIAHSTPLEAPQPHGIVVPVEIHSPPQRKRRKTIPVQEHIIEEPTIPRESNILLDIPIAESTKISEANIQQLADTASNIMLAAELPLATSGVLPNVTIETELPPAAEVGKRKKYVISDNVDECIETKRIRLKTIKLKVKNWNFDKGGLTIEDVCSKPINRLNIAAAFGDLLVLHKMEYVKLTNKPNSLELGFIEKGAKCK